MKGSAPLVHSKNRAAVTALREIAAGKVHYDRPSHDAVVDLHRRAEQARVREPDWPAPRRRGDRRARGGLPRALRRPGVLHGDLRVAGWPTSSIYVNLALERGRAGARVRRGQRPHRAAAWRAPGSTSWVSTTPRRCSPTCGRRLREEPAGRARRHVRLVHGRHAPGTPPPALPAGHLRLQHGAAPVHARRRRALPRRACASTSPRAAVFVVPTSRRRRSRTSRAIRTRPYHAPRFRHPTTGDDREERGALRLRSGAAGALRVDGVRAGRSPREAWMTPLATASSSRRSGRRCCTTTACRPSRSRATSTADRSTRTSDVMVWHARRAAVRGKAPKARR